MLIKKIRDIEFHLEGRRLHELYQYKDDKVIFKCWFPERPTNELIDKCIKELMEIEGGKND